MMFMKQSLINKIKCKIFYAIHPKERAREIAEDLYYEEMAKIWEEEDKFEREIY